MFSQLFGTNRFAFSFGNAKHVKNADFIKLETVSSKIPLVVILSIFLFFFGSLTHAALSMSITLWSGIDSVFIIIAACFVTGCSFALIMMSLFFLLSLLFNISGYRGLLIRSGQVETVFGSFLFFVSIRWPVSEIQRAEIQGGDEPYLAFEDTDGERNIPFDLPIGETELFAINNALDINRDIDSGLDDGEGWGYGDEEQISKNEVKTTVTLKSPSTIVLIISNLIPVFGTLFFNWDVGNVILLYWAESGIIFFYIAIKTYLSLHLFGLIFILLSSIHFFIFMSVHLVLIWALFIQGIKNLGTETPFTLHDIQDYMFILWPALLGILISHGYSLKVNFLDKKRSFDLKESFLSFYSRIFIMQFVVIVGAFFVILLDNNIGALLVLIAIKIVADSRSHIKQNST